MVQDIVRPVGTGAIYSTSRHALGICRRVANTCRYTVPRSKIASVDLQTRIEQAVAKVVLDHGILGVGIAGEDTKCPSFTWVESLDLRDMIRWQLLDPRRYDEAILDSLKKCHDSLWENLSARPGWEVVVYATHGETEEVDVAFTFHHAYGDGVASKLFHRDLLQALNGDSGPPAELIDHVLHLPVAPSLLPGMEVIVPLKISWSYLLRTIWNEIIWKDLVPVWFISTPPADSISWTGEKVLVEPFKTNIRLLPVSENELMGLLRACRSHGTTLTPTLHAFVAASLSSRLPAEVAPAFATTTPIDLRRCAKPEYDLANNVASLVAGHEGFLGADVVAGLRKLDEKDGRASEAAIWSAATSLGTQIREKATSLPNDDVIGMMDWISDWEQFWTQKYGKPRSSSWEVSNIGTLQNPSIKGEGEAECVITRSIMTQGALPAGSAFCVNVSGVAGNGICITLTWQESIVEESLIDGVVSDLSKLIGRFQSS